MSSPVVFHDQNYSLLTPAQEEQVIEEFRIHMQTMAPQMNEIAHLFNESARHAELARIHGEKAQLSSEAAKLSSEAAKLSSERAKLSSEAARISSENASKCDEKAKKCNEDALSHQVKALQLAKSSEDKKTAGEEKIAAAQKGRQDLLATQFYLIFNAKKPEPTELGNLFNKYLTDGSISIEKNPQGASYLKINSMLSVIRYLNDNLHVKNCNFKAFKGEVQDVSSLVNHLTASKISAVTFSTLISPENKAELAKAKSLRTAAFPLEIKFV